MALRKSACTGLSASQMRISAALKGSPAMLPLDWPLKAIRVSPPKKSIVTHEIVGDILVLTYDLPGESVNTLTRETNDALEAALSVLELDSALVGAVGEFSAGLRRCGTPSHK